VSDSLLRKGNLKMKKLVMGMVVLGVMTATSVFADETAKMVNVLNCSL
jgi:hypothetical protein